ncbi:hypothetical protein B0H14DRAFT_3499756 [Mycena olivaceomarginata]|nr:hypothetical protein B0H14DRAFT_3499756 [Mycena olivaceomarginata]
MSRGSSHIVSADATAAPSFDLVLLQSPFDLYILTKAAQRARTFATQSSLVPFLAAAGEISPGTAVSTDAQFEQFVKDAVGVGYHPLGTAAIGIVVDADLRVQGSGVCFSFSPSMRAKLTPGANPDAPGFQVPPGHVLHGS